MIVPRRGQVWLIDLHEDLDPKLFVVVSNNRRNEALDSFLGVRLTTTEKYTELASVVKLPAGESFSGWVRCDTLTELWKDECVGTEPRGALTSRAMSAVEEGLKAALDIGR